jgi:hypothetical protein
MDLEKLTLGIDRRMILIKLDWNYPVGVRLLEMSGGLSHF